MGFAARATGLLAAPLGAWSAPIGSAVLLAIDGLTLRMSDDDAEHLLRWPLAIPLAVAVTVGAVLWAVVQWLRGRPPPRAGTAFVVGSAVMSALRLVAAAAWAVGGLSTDGTELLAGVAVALTAWGSVRLAREGNLRAALAMMALAHPLYLMPVWGAHTTAWERHGHVFWDIGVSHMH